MSTPLRVIYAGTPEFAVSALNALVHSSHKVVAVYTQPDRPAGRGRKLCLSPVKEFALAHGLQVVQPDSLKRSDVQNRLAEFKPDVMVVAAYGLILPQAVLDIPRCGCLNIHASLLPRWRGAAPIQRALLAGDVVTGVSLMVMNAGLDTGPVIAMRSVELLPHHTAGDVHDALAPLGAELLLQYLEDWCEGKRRAVEQDVTQACYASKLDKSEAEINWQHTADFIKRQVVAFNPWPVAHTRHQQQALRIWAAEVLDHETPDQAAGYVSKTSPDGIEVVTGKGVLVIKQLQLAGGKPMSASAFLNAHALLGQQLGVCV